MAKIFTNLRLLFSQDQNQVQHTLGERHDRTEIRLDQAEPRLDASEQRLDVVEQRADSLTEKLDTAIDKADGVSEELVRIRQLLETRLDKFEQNIETRLDTFEENIDKRVDKRFETLEQLHDARFGGIEARLDILEEKIGEELSSLSSRIDKRADNFEFALSERFDQFDAAVDDRLTNYESVVDQRLETYTTEMDQRFATYSENVDLRFDERLTAVETRNDEQQKMLIANVNQTFDQRARALDARTDDRHSNLERNLDQRLNGFEKGIDSRLFNREKYVDDRLVRIGDDIVARTDLLLQHVEQRMDQLRRGMRLMLEAKDAPAEQATKTLAQYDQLMKSRQALSDIAAQVKEHLAQNPEDTKAHYFKIIEWKNEAIESLKKYSPDEQEIVDYIWSFIDRTNPKHVSYAETHMRRFVATLNRIPPPQRTSAKLLELGSCFFFTPAIQKFCGYTNISCADWFEGAPNKAEQRIAKQISGKESHTYETQLFNAEHDKFPYADNTFQAVLCCEMLEHLSRDPMHLFWECNRVMEMDGLLLVTTPNITSVRSIEGLLTGYPPYLWMKYNTQDTAQQHYHEHTPETVKTLLNAAGFTMVELATEDVWAKSNPATLKLLQKLMFSPDLRGDNIFALARKTSAPKDRYPESLYILPEQAKPAVKNADILKKK